jgi:hypothetical protein
MLHPVSFRFIRAAPSESEFKLFDCQRIATILRMTRPDESVAASVAAIFRVSGCRIEGGASTTTARAAQ